MEEAGVGRKERQAVRRRRRLAPATLLASLIHLQIIALLFLVAYLSAPREADVARQNAEPIEISTLSDEESQQVAEELKKQEAQEKKEKKEEEEKITPPGQVVDLPTPHDQTPPREAHFAAEHDS